MNLRQCPWCGSENVDEGTASTDVFDEGFYAQCDDCGFMVQGPTELSVQVPWNNASEVGQSEAE